MRKIRSCDMTLSSRKKNGNIFFIFGVPLLIVRGCMSKKVRYQFFTTSGTCIGIVNDSKHFPESWKPNTQQKKQKKKQDAVKAIFVFTSDELTPKKSKWIEDWSAVKIGDQFWLRSGERLYIISDDVIYQKKWETVFSEIVSYKLAAAKFLELSLNDQTKFCKLSSANQISLLKVPDRHKKHFNDVRWNLKSLIKYANEMATRSERRHKEKKEKEEREYLQKSDLNCKMLAATQDDTFGALDIQDTGNVHNGCKSRLEFMVGVEVTPFLLLGAYIESVFDDGGDFLDIDSDFLVFAEQKLQPAQHKSLPIKVRFTGNDLRREFNLLENIRIARGNGIINRDVLDLIVGFYEWRYTHKLNL